MSDLVQSNPSSLSSVYAPRNIEEAFAIAERLASSSIVPACYRDRPGDVFAAMAYGAELGFTGLTSLQTIKVINGKASMDGDGMRALIMANRDNEGIFESVEGESTQNPTAVCTIKRRGMPDVTRRFSWEDACRANLTGKKGPWQEYPLRMLAYRALGFAARDAWPDLFRGIISSEEASDYPARDIPTEVVSTSRAVVDPVIRTIGELPDVETESEATKPEKATRKRRTKAEIEADRLASVVTADDANDEVPVLPVVEIPVAVQSAQTAPVVEAAPVMSFASIVKPVNESSEKIRKLITRFGGVENATKVLVANSLMAEGSSLDALPDRVVDQILSVSDDQFKAVCSASGVVL